MEKNSKEKYEQVNRILYWVWELNWSKLQKKRTYAREIIRYGEME